MGWLQSKLFTCRGLLRKTSTIVAYLLAGLIRLIGGIAHWRLVA
jgi:hypothetical protein